jgi:Periplasmic binding protein-like domain
MKAVLNAGLSVPRDIAIAGYGNVTYADFMRVPLTSVDQQGTEIGKRAAKLALSLLENRPRGRNRSSSTVIGDPGLYPKKKRPLSDAARTQPPVRRGADIAEQPRAWIQRVATPLVGRQYRSRQTPLREKAGLPSAVASYLLEERIAKSPEHPVFVVSGSSSVCLRARQMGPCKEDVLEARRCLIEDAKTPTVQRGLLCLYQRPPSRHRTARGHTGCEGTERHRSASRSGNCRRGGHRQYR